MSEAAPSRSTCAPHERTIFACEARTQIVTVCATGSFGAGTGALTYRFGEFGREPELVHGSTPATVAGRFEYMEDFWSKGEEISLKFKVGKFEYLVHHAHGAFGVDGGPNRAGVRVSRGSREVADIACDEATVVNSLYDELSGTQMHRTLE